MLGAAGADLQQKGAPGLVSSARTGRDRIWELQTKRLAEVSRYLDEISDQWDEALKRLRVFVEKDKR